ncbi:hypothetical protein Aperf_G00000047375 [Anoplocephala perfoliata]
MDLMWRYIVPISFGLGTAVFVVIDRVEKRGVFGSELDVAKELFHGGRWITCNVITAAMAISCVFSPSLVTETLYISTISALCLLIARTISLLLCFYLWHKIAQLGFDSYFNFIAFRYDNILASAIYLINSFLCFLYILFVYNGPLLHSQIEHFKLNSAHLNIFLIFVLLCSFGGLRIALPLCSILTIMEICGSTLLLIKVQRFNVSSSIDFVQQQCHSHNPLHPFAVAFQLLLTAQPIYKMYYHLNSHKKVMMAMSLGYCIFLLKFLLAFFVVRPIFSHARSLNIKEGQAFRAAFINLSENDTLPETDPRTFALLEGTLTNLSDFVLVCVVYGPMAAFYCLRLCQLVSELCESIIPFLQSISARLTCGEIHLLNGSGTTKCKSECPDAGIPPFDPLFSTCNNLLYDSGFHYDCPWRPHARITVRAYSISLGDYDNKYGDSNVYSTLERL